MLILSYCNVLKCADFLNPVTISDGDWMHNCRSSRSGVLFISHTARFQNSLYDVDCKGKAVPLQAWSGPEGSRKLRFPDFMPTAQDGGKVVSLTHRPPLPPGNTPGTHFC